MNDFSFLRLEPSLEAGRNTRPQSIADIFFLSQVQLSPKEFYCQVTNTKNSIAFDGNYSVYLVDCSGAEVLDITEKVQITEFTYNGLPQIKFEIAPIGNDFYRRPLLLRFKHTVSDAVWYSNPINVTDYKIEETTRFNYRNFTGIDAIADVFQSIRLQCYFVANDNESEITEYTQINGNQVSGRAIITELEKYYFDKIDNFTFRRLNRMLTNSVIYINGNRCTNKQTIQSGEPLGTSNVWNQEFTVPTDYSDTFNDIPQIWEQFVEVDFAPIEFVSSADELSLTYNRNITASDTATIRLYKDGDLLDNFTTFVISGETVTVDCGSLSTGEYRVEVDSGSFVSEFGETRPLFFWEFTIASGEYDSASYNNEYLI